MARVHGAGAFFLVRLPWSTVPLVSSDGTPFDLFRFLRGVSAAELAEEHVSFNAGKGSKVPCRIVAIRRSAAAAESARARVLSERSRKGRSIDPRSLEAAEYTILLTNLDEARLSPHEAAEIYRFRWQIEIVFKRLKSVLDLDRIQAYEPALVETYVFGKLLGALLVEDLTDRYLSFSPWGYPLGSTPCLRLAPLQDDARPHSLAPPSAPTFKSSPHW